MKRYGYVYDRMVDWDLLKEAQNKACAGRRNKGVTKMRTRFIDLGGKHYEIDENCTSILKVNGRKVVSVDGVAVFEDNNEQVTF